MPGRERVQEVLRREGPKLVVEPDDHDVVCAGRREALTGELRGKEARDPGAGPDDLLGVWLEDDRDRARLPLTSGARRGLQEMPVAAMHPVEDAERHDGRPDRRDVELHASGPCGTTFSGRSSPPAREPTPISSPACVEDLDAPRCAIVVGLRRAVHEAPRGVGIQRHRRQREQLTNRPHRLGQSTLGRQRLEPIWRERVLRQQAGSLRATQGVEMGSGPEPLAEVAGDRPDIGARARSEDRSGRPAIPRPG